MKKNKKKKRALKPDETFSFGPFQMARFGQYVLSKMNWAPGQFKMTQERLATNHDTVIAEIDSIVEEAAQLVSTLPPLELLHRAWWMRAKAMLGITSEFDIGKSEALAERMVDYVQSLVAGYPRPEEQKKVVSDEDWAKLESLIDKIFSTLNSSYFIGATAKRRKDEPGISPAMEIFYFQTQLYWANVKASQYQIHQIQTLRELLAPQSNIISTLYGLTSDELCDELAKLQHTQTFGISDAFNSMRLLHEKFVTCMKADIEAGLIEGENPQEILQKTIDRNNLREESNIAAGLFFGYDLLDVSKNASLPERFMRDFAWEPGEDSEFFADGAFRGWPLRVWPTFKRPFLKIESRYYCFDSSTLFDRIYRQIEKRAFALGKPEKQRWIDARKNITEDLPFAYLERILPGARIIKGVYYKTREDSTEKWCELDGIIAFDDHLFVVEVKAGAFTYTSPTTDVEAHVNSLKNLVAAPAEQGNRFLRYIRTADEVPLFDVRKEETFRLRLSDYRHVTLCAVTLDPFTEIAAQSQNLFEIGVTLGDTPVWSISIDDIRVYADIFDNPLEFLHFVEQRNMALKSKLLQLDDELDHLGLYLKHNQYELYAHQLANGQDRSLRFTGYRIEIDKYFAAKMQDVQHESPLRQDLPHSLAAVLDLLGKEKRQGSARLASYLLDLAGDSRKTLFAETEERLRKGAGGRVGTTSTTGDVRITIQPWLGNIDPESSEILIDYAKAMLVLNNETDRLLMILHYDPTITLKDLTWHWISREDIRSHELPRIQRMAEELRLRRLQAATATGKIARNAPCPCGSGRRHKKCCLGRST